jgi:hypothetical protein|tara:strand:- start:968 stop:1447 length:480 start_codon:yes stop_codon:yes gene_type:complete
MVEKRNVRANEIRDPIRQQKPAVSWKPPSLLDAPECRPGYVQRWITTSIQGKETPDNVYKRMREGWNPRSADSVKDKRYPTINHGEWKGCIGIEGMLLCEMPEETHRSMKAYYNQRNSEQNEAVASDLDALGRKTGQPIYQTRESTSSRGRDLSIMDDK